MSKLHLQFQKRWSKVKVKRVKVTKVVGQGHRVKVKVVKGVLYPIDWREVRHAGVFINYISHAFLTRHKYQVRLINSQTPLQNWSSQKEKER